MYEYTLDTHVDYGVYPVVNYVSNFLICAFHVTWGHVLYAADKYYILPANKKA